MIKYLFKLDPKSKQHLWNTKKNDTYCKMWSTNGISDKYKWIETRTDTGRETCKMCLNAKKE